MTLEQLEKRCRESCRMFGYDNVTIQKVQGDELELRVSYRGFIVGYYRETGWKRQPSVNGGQYDGR